MDSECFMVTVNIASNISVIVLHIQYPTKVYNTVTVACILCRSDAFRSFVDYCLLKIPQDRPSSAELLRVSNRTHTMSTHTHAGEVITSLISIAHLSSIMISECPHSTVNSLPLLVTFSNTLCKHTCYCMWNTHVLLTHRLLLYILGSEM